MKKALFIISIFYTLKAIAQPTFTATDLNPVIGDTYAQITLDSAGITEGSSGPNQIWNFNVILNPLSILNSNYIAPNLAPSFGAFPSANIVVTDGTNPGSDYSFYNASNNKLEFFGNIEVDSMGNVDTTKYLTPLTQLEYPLTYQSAFTDSNSTGFVNSGFFPVNIKYARDMLADAHGDITINNQLFSNVLRLNYKDTFTVDVGFFQSQLFIDVYQWFKQGYKSPIFSIVKSFDGTSPATKSVFLSGALSPATLQAIKENQVTIYPNPAIDVLKITNGFKGTTVYTIKEASGKEMFSNELNVLSKSIDITSLEGGMYILELKSKDKTLVKKFIKRSY